MSEQPKWDGKTTPSVAEFLEMEKGDRQLWWKMKTGHHLNLFGAAVEQLSAANTEIVRLNGLLTEFVDGENQGEKWPPEPSS